MKERPIIYSTPMVKAILEGRKTQTRRVVKPQPNATHDGEPYWFSGGYRAWEYRSTTDVLRKGGNVLPCPYGKPGDRLWVRESGWERPERTAKMMREGADTWPRFAYVADSWSEDDHADFKRWGFKRRPSIHMPRWACRLVLPLVSVRVERVQSITETDARAEGLRRTENGWTDGATGDDVTSARAAFQELWASIYGQEAWDSNPWVWVAEWKEIEVSR